jgi:hypothetical protein
MAAVVVGHRAARVDPARQDEPDGPRTQDERVVVPVAGLRPGVGHQVHSVDGLEELRGLGGVADRPHDGVPAGDRERVLRGVVLDEPDELPELVEVELGHAFLAGDGVGLIDAHDRPPRG